ncbi:glycosyltransferase family 2 protein [Dactylosporangium sp. CA-233914]|uniref:glycosyltransferase family 2 protein n=1 Tax=Dactylosporangium sp. CA-233914 TaxID=3239934 RepID=UPI003D8C1509
MFRSTEPVVSIVTVAHNAREGLLRGLAAVQTGTEVPTETVVVDNGSTDNTAAAVRHAFREVKLLRRSEALPPLAAVNLGAARAKAPWLLLLDPGLGPVGDAVRTLVEYAGSHPEDRLYTGRTLRDGSDDGRTLEAPPTLWGTACLAFGLPFEPERLPKLDRAIGGEVPAVTPRMLLVERELWRRLGGFDERLPAADLSMRARSLGARPVLIPDAQMTALTPQHPPARLVSTALLTERMAFAHRHFTPQRARAAGWLLSTAALTRSITGEPWLSIWRRRDSWLSTPDPMPFTSSSPGLSPSPGLSGSPDASPPSGFIPSQGRTTGLFDRDAAQP